MFNSLTNMYEEAVHPRERIGLQRKLRLTVGEFVFNTRKDTRGRTLKSVLT